MKTALQIQLDKRLGTLMNLVLYLPVRITGKLLRINHQLNRDFKRIVVAKYKGMGSIVQASPLLASLRNAFPDAEIIFVSTRQNRGILDYYSRELSGCILVDDHSIFSLAKTSLGALFRLWKFRPQLFIDLEVYSSYGTFISTLSAATNRLGYYKSDKDYRTGLYTHLMYYNIKAPLSEIYLQTARMLKTGDIQHELASLKRNEAVAISIRGRFPELGKKYIVINPNASDLRLERRWPDSAFVELIDHLHRIFPEYMTVLIGNRQEADYVQRIAARIKLPGNVLNPAGKLSLPELIELIRGASIVVTNDTGPLHLSLALKKPTVGLFGPCSPAQYGQMQTCIPVYKNLYCSPCVHEFVMPPCRGNNRCMKDIRAEDVIAAIGKAESLTTEQHLPAITYLSSGTVLGFVENRTGTA